MVSSNIICDELAAGIGTFSVIRYSLYVHSYNYSKNICGEEV